ncbi:MAG: rrmJ [Rickettsiaceae bacterium]|jgi:23S rRNA (uridine2552-2'-O)-methyltransferase|nr:rrmJ [Rickettsiaceae bacterium]
MRGKFTRVKTAKSRSVSSTRWLQRQLNDPLVILAKKEGYRSRAAFKLLDIEEKFKIFKPGLKVLDLGAAPGGWTQVAVKLTKSLDNPQSKVIALDLLPIEEIPGAISLQKDFYDFDATDLLKETLGSQADIVMSDMAANTTGHQATDHLKIIDLCERAYDFAVTILKPEGHFIAKIFQGGAEQILLSKIKQNFAQVKHFKPKSSRADSSEIYVIAIGFKGGLTQ